MARVSSFQLPELVIVLAQTHCNKGTHVDGVVVERFKYGNAALHMCLPAQGKLSQPTPFYTFLDMACLYIERWGEACNNVL